MDRVEASAEIEAADGYEAAAKAFLEQRAAEGQEGGKPEERAAFGGIEGAELDRELVASGVAVADEGLGLGVEVLLGVADALAERRGDRLVQDTHAGAGAGVDVHAVEPGVVVGAAGSDRPDLARGERVGPYLVVAPHLRGEDELLYPVLPDPVREMGVAELDRAYALLLLLDPPTALEREPYGPLEVLVGDGLEGVRIKEFEETAYGLLDAAVVSRPERAPPNCTRPWRVETRLSERRRSQHSERKSLTRPKCPVKRSARILGTSQPGR